MPERARLDRLLTPEDVADICQISVRTVLKLARRGELRSLRFGNRVRFAPDEVAAWLRARGGGQ
jgi:excisionase family DNA binding protein